MFVYNIEFMVLSCCVFWQDDTVAAQRYTTEEKKALDRAQSDVYSEIRRAAEAHRLDVYPELKYFCQITICYSLSRICYQLKCVFVDITCLWLYYYEHILFPLNVLTMYICSFLILDKHANICKLT